MGNSTNLEDHEGILEAFGPADSGIINSHCFTFTSKIGTQYNHYFVLNCSVSNVAIVVYIVSPFHSSWPLIIKVVYKKMAFSLTIINLKIEFWNTIKKEAHRLCN